MCSVFLIPQYIAHKYRGPGYAMGTVIGGRIVNLMYLRDVLPEFDDEDFHLDVLDDPRIGPAVRMLQSSGEVYFGMCSCWQFVEL